MNTPEETTKIVTKMWKRNYQPTVKDTKWLKKEINKTLDGFFYKSTPDTAEFYEAGLREEIGGLIEEIEEAEESSVSGDPIKPDHYKNGDKDLMDEWYDRLYHSEKLFTGREVFIIVMKSLAERYTRRYPDKNPEDLSKGVYTLERLKEYEEMEK